MRLIILVIAALAGLFWGLQLLEGAPDSCSALALRAVAIESQRSGEGSAFGQALATGLAGAFEGSVAENAAARKYPDVPDPASVN